MFRSRIAQTVTLTLILMPVFALFRPPSLFTGIPPDTMFLKKLHWNAQFDIVLAGCSRAVAGLSPSAMRQELSGERIGNFGFNSQTYSPDYLQALRRPLDPESRRKAVVFSVQPLNFMPGVHDRSGYVICRRQDPLGQFMTLNFGDVVYSLRPYNYKDIRRLATGNQDGFYQDCHPDGWISGRLVPEDLHFYTQQYNVEFMREKVSPKLVGDFMETVRSLRRGGVAVFAVRLPTTPETLEMENTRTGFDERSFRRQLRLAGGVWIDLPDKRYHSFDGSHLSKDGAIEVSRMVAKRIRERLASTSGGVGQRG